MPLQGLTCGALNPHSPPSRASARHVVMDAILASKKLVNF